MNDFNNWTGTELIKDVLRVLIKDQINYSYVASATSKVSESEGLGLLVSKYFKYDGVQIVKTFLSALEDANFHTESEKVEKIFIESKILQYKLK